MKVIIRYTKRIVIFQNKHIAQKFLKKKIVSRKNKTKIYNVR